MSYKIAIASSDEIHIDETFGSAKSFHIFEIEDGKYQKMEERFAKENKEELQCGELTIGCDANCPSLVGGGCTGGEGNSQKVELIADCRCVICKKIGFHMQKQLERKAIAIFDVDCTVIAALEKIIFYYDKIDKRQSLRGVGNKI